MTLNSTQQRIFDDRYALKDKTGKQLETQPEEMWKRVADYIGDNVPETEAFYGILHGFKFVPGGRILAGAGAETEKTFYNCYVIPVEARRNDSTQDYPGNDSREAIFDTIKTMVDIMSRGGGVGINWSVLRPSGAYLTRISGTSSGPVGWMDVASTAVGEVEQGGSRRGAAMFMLDDWHPDVLNFINAKKDKAKIKNANVSVAISNAFMEAVKADGDWNLDFPDTTDPLYNSKWDGDLARWKSLGGNVRTHTTIRARELWQGIAQAAWSSGEPGVVFLERYNEQSTAGDIERIISVNPCGEQGLGAYSVCNLGSMNLKAYIEHYDNGIGFDFFKFDEDVHVAVRFLDNVIDKSFYFLKQTKEQQMKLRRIGLGVMGLADALILLGIRYGSPEAVAFTERVFRTMKEAAIRESADLAFKKGAALGWNSSMWERPFLKQWREESDVVALPPHGLRNLFLLTQAPTGTTSMWADVNSGIEPLFSTVTYRHDRTGQHMVTNTTVAEASVGMDEGTFYPDYIVTADKVTVEEHVATQAAVQRNVDSSVSKTINAPKDQSVEEVEKAFTLAYDSGLKGIAYYRDGSRSEQVLYREDPNEAIAKLTQEVADLKAKLAFRERVDRAEGVKFYGATGENRPFVTGLKPLVFAQVNLKGPDSCPACPDGTVVYEEGCRKCYSCGWSAC